VFFGHIPVPRQPLFFSTFLYHNHWGAFAVLMTAVCLGLVWRYALVRRGPGFYQSPAFGGLIAVLFLAATAPKSASRSCTFLMGLVLAGAFLHWAVRLARKRRSRRESIVEPLIGAGIVAALAIAAIAYLASDVIRERLNLTQQQLADMKAQGGIGSRVTLYRDTWRMAEDRLLFGWGMASYPNVFMLYNSQSPSPIDHLPVFYNDAHNDWLQAVAEHGLFGSAVLGLCALAPLSGLRRLGSGSPLSAYLFGGCALILAYAWIEFPFGNVAVVLTWWMCFFSALRYAQLQAHEALRQARVEESPA
jgi:O-antigen ligase